MNKPTIRTDVQIVMEILEKNLKNHSWHGSCCKTCEDIAEEIVDALEK